MLVFLLLSDDDPACAVAARDPQRGIQAAAGFMTPVRRLDGLQPGGQETRLSPSDCRAWLPFSAFSVCCCPEWGTPLAEPVGMREAAPWPVKTGPREWSYECSVKGRGPQAEGDTMTAVLPIGQPISGRYRMLSLAGTRVPPDA